jgi:alpha-tubulin suppressor-like RCC1 family protein
MFSLWKYKSRVLPNSLTMANLVVYSDWRRRLSAVNNQKPLAMTHRGIILVLLTVCILFASCQKSVIFGTGSNGFSGLIDGTYLDRSIPVKGNLGVIDGKLITSLKCRDEGCTALTSENKIYSWGGSGSGEAATGSSSYLYTPTAANMTGSLNGTTIASISRGDHHVVAVTSTGEVHVWGLNGSGQLVSIHYAIIN